MTANDSTSLLPQLLLESARRCPDDTAVVDGERTLSYDALAVRAGRIATTLQHLGVVPGDRVAILIDKSADAVCAIHGVLLAGACYVPLDPQAPAARLESIAADCAVRVLLTTGAHASGWLGDGAPVAGVEHVVVVAAGNVELTPSERLTPPDVVDAAAPVRTAPAISADAPAYILSTSGSTGRPKGVTLSHRNALAFVGWAVRTLGLRAHDRFSSHAPFHFDLSIFDLFCPVWVGAPVVLVPRRAAPFPAALANWIRSERITVWYSVPTALALLAARGGLEPGSLPDLRLVLFAGEVFPVPELVALMELVPGAELWNLYGPTETNVCTAHRVPATLGRDDPPVPIGHAIEGVAVVVVRSDDTVVDPGEEGELLVSGPTVASGYWGDPELTHERFVRLDTVPALGADRVWYRTGDRVVQLEDGALRFVGRRDHQVKTRGYRVDLGDIEAALHRLPGVRECAAVAVPDELVSNRLHAVVVTDAPIPEDQFVAHCRASLPPYMVPESFVSLDALPKTSTGKLDRRAVRDLLVQDAPG